MVCFKMLLEQYPQASLITSLLKSKQVELQKAEPPITEIIMKPKVHLTVGYPSKTFHKELKVGKAITLLLMHPHREL